MKPFDLEAAKRGEPLYTPLNGEAYFIGVKRDGNVVLEYEEGWIETRRQNEIFMAPKKRTVWVNLFPNNTAMYYESEKLADAGYKSYERIGEKSYPVEIEE